MLEEKFQITMTKRMVLHALGRMGYKYGKLKKYGTLKMKIEKKIRIREYLLLYHDALKRYVADWWSHRSPSLHGVFYFLSRSREEGGPIIVYMDETFVHQKHSKVFSW